jgi:hypothetical protein
MAACLILVLYCLDSDTRQFLARRLTKPREGNKYQNVRLIYEKIWKLGGFWIVTTYLTNG